MIPTFLELLLPLCIAYYYTAYSWEVVLLVAAYGGPSTQKFTHLEFSDVI